MPTNNIFTSKVVFQEWRIHKNFHKETTAGVDHLQTCLTQNEEIEDLNRPIASKKIETVIKNLATKKSSRQDNFPGEFYWTFKELAPILLKFFQQTEEKGIFLNSFYKAGITLILKPEKGPGKKRKRQANIPGEHRCRSPQQNTHKPHSRA